MIGFAKCSQRSMHAALPRVLGALVLGAALAPGFASLAIPADVATAQDVQEIAVQVSTSGVSPNWIDAQTGPIRLGITTSGGPYTVTISPLVDPRPLPADTTTYVGFDAPEAGEYTLELSGAGQATATLNVTLPGF